MEENGLVGLEPIAVFIGEQRRPTAQASWEPKAVTALAGRVFYDKGTIPHRLSSNERAGWQP